MQTPRETRRSADFTRLPRAASEFWPAAIPAAQGRHGRRSASACVNAMPANALIDTGAILALLDKTDRWHEPCVSAFGQLRLPLLTSEAVLTELFHLAGETQREMEGAWKFVRSGALVLSVI